MVKIALYSRAMATLTFVLVAVDGNNGWVVEAASGRVVVAVVLKLENNVLVGAATVVCVDGEAVDI